MIKTREQLLNKTAIKDTAAKNFYENATLGATIRRNAAKLYENTLSQIGLGIDGARDAIAKSTLISKITEGTARLYNNSVALIGQGIDTVRDMWAKSTLTTKIATGVTEIANNTRIAVGLALSKARALVENLINFSLLKQGVHLMTNIVRKGMILAKTVAQAIAEAAILAFKSAGLLVAAGIAGAIMGAIATKALTKSKKHSGGLITGTGDNSQGLNSDEVNLTAQEGEYMVQKSAVNKLKPSDLATINQGELPTSPVTPQIVQNNKVMEEKLDKQNNYLEIIAANIGKPATATINYDITAIPDLNNYTTDVVGATVGGGGTARVGLA